MADLSHSAPVIMRSIRIVSGLFMLAFVTSHLINLSFGLISIEAMDTARPYVTGVWTGRPVNGLLFIAFLLHFVLGHWALYWRPTLRTNVQDFVQLVTGLFLVPLLATHAIGISMALNSGMSFGYADAIRMFWLHVPSLGLLQVIMIAFVWVHGCAGLFTWLRSKENASRLLGWLYIAAVAVPILAFLGYAEAGREMLTAGFLKTPLSRNSPIPEDVTVPFTLIKQLTSWVIYGSIVISVVTLCARFIRVKLQPAHEVVLVRDDSEEMPSNSMVTVLDGFRQNNQNHASLCEGRGRCGTCAVHVLETQYPLPRPTELELRTLQRVKAPAGARLACQVKVAGGKLKLAAIYPGDYTFEDARPQSVEIAREETTPQEEPHQQGASQ